MRGQQTPERRATRLDHALSMPLTALAEFRRGSLSRLPGVAEVHRHTERLDELIAYRTGALAIETPCFSSLANARCLSTIG